MPGEVIQTENSITIKPEQTGPEAPATGQEQLIAGKFKNQGELEKAYIELEKKLGSKTEEPAPKPEETPPDDKQVAKALTVAGLDMSEFTKEYEEKGDLSEDSFKALEEKGFPKALVKAYIDGKKAQMELETVRAESDAREIKAIAGGDDSYQQMLQWASANADSKTIDTFNAEVLSGDKDRAKAAVQKLHAQYENAVGRDAKRFIAGETTKTDSDVFRSMAEVTVAMRDPRYKTDPAYNRYVVEKLGRSNI